jgi:lambda repressor-like predicted transcriptional regulator
MQLIGMHREDVKAALRKRWGSVARFERLKGLPAKSVHEVMRGRKSARVSEAIERALTDPPLQDDRAVRGPGRRPCRRRGRPVIPSYQRAIALSRVRVCAISRIETKTRKDILAVIAQGGTHLSAAQLAQLALPGLPKSKRGVQFVADRESWPWIERPGRGGGRLYAIENLPEPARKALEGPAPASSPPTCAR